MVPSMKIHTMYFIRSGSFYDAGFNDCIRPPILERMDDFGRVMRPLRYIETAADKRE